MTEICHLMKLVRRPFTDHLFDLFYQDPVRSLSHCMNYEHPEFNEDAILLASQVLRENNERT